MTGLFVIVLSTMLGKDFFMLCLCGIAITGAASSFGESVALGFLKRFPPEQVSYLVQIIQINTNSFLVQVNAWSSGTGMAGVGGAGLYIIFAVLGMNLTWSMAVLIPLVFVYWAMFFIVSYYYYYFLKQ
jgi:hypothetical protein